MEQWRIIAGRGFSEQVPGDAIVFDCQGRSPTTGRGTSRVPFAAMSSNCSAKPRRSTATAPTVLYCVHGIQAACPAECMQRAGIEAHCFKGGQRGVLAWGRSRGLAPD